MKINDHLFEASDYTNIKLCDSATDNGANVLTLRSLLFFLFGIYLFLFKKQIYREKETDRDLPAALPK